MDEMKRLIRDLRDGAKEREFICEPETYGPRPEAHLDEDGDLCDCWHPDSHGSHPA